MTGILAVEHQEHLTDKPFDDALTELYAVTGSLEEGVGVAVADSADRDDFEAKMKNREGSSGFMRFMVLNHGAWLTKLYERPTKAVLIILGNPLVAITMLEHDIGAGLNVPTRVYLEETADGQTRLSYDLPSTLMGNLTEEAQAAARKLDEKIVAFATRLAGPVIR